MSKVIISKTKLDNIANAIRSKTGSSSGLTLDQMASEVSSLEKVYTITANLQNGIVADILNTKYMAPNGTITLKFIATDVEYIVPDNITNLYGAIGSYTVINKREATLTLSEPTDNISFSIIGQDSFEPEPWSTASIDNIRVALQKANAGTLDLTEYWSIGDAREVTIGDKTVNAILAHKFTGTPDSVTAPYALSNGKYPQYAVLLSPIYAKSKYMSDNIAQKYFEGILHTAENTTYYNALPSDFKSLLQSWQCYVGKENTTSSAITGTYNQAVYMAAPACKETGLENQYNATENSSTITFDYFSGSDAKTKRAAMVDTEISNYMWLRSPISCNNGSYRAYYVNFEGDRYHSGVDSTIGVASICCI